MFVPLLLDLVRVENRPELFLVFVLDRDKQTANLFCLGSGLVERGVRWAMLEDAWDDWGKLIPGAFCEFVTRRPNHSPDKPESGTTTPD
jgi:hypothetical protein